MAAAPPARVLGAPKENPMLDPASATPPTEPASLGLQTRSIHAGEALDPSTGAVGVPL